MPDAAGTKALTQPAKFVAPYRVGRLTLEVRQNPSMLLEFAALVGAVLLGAAITCAILLGAGLETADLIDAFITENLSGGSGILAVLSQTAPLVLVGLSASIAFRVRFWNIGIEGQMIGGAIAATAVATYDIGPASLHLPLMLGLSAVGGMIAILLPAILKFKLAVNEIITTLLLNYVIVDVMLELLFDAWHDPKDFFPHTAAFTADERFGTFSNGFGTELVVALVLVLLLGFVVHWSRPGLYMRFIHANGRMARAIGLPVAAVTLGAVMLSGSVAGIAGLVLIGQEGRLDDGFFAGYGFSGILIAFLARNNPFAVAAVAFLVAMLFDAGRSLQVFNQIPFSMVQLVQAIIVMCVAGAEFFVRYRLRWSR